MNGSTDAKWKIFPLVLALLFAAFPGLLAAQRPLGPPFQVNVKTLNVSQVSRVAMNARGDFVVTWVGLSPHPNNHILYARRFAADGTPATGEIPLLDAKDTFADAGLAMMDDGSVVIVLEELQGLVARRYGPDGEFLGESDVASGNPIRQFSISPRGRGGFAVAWAAPDGLSWVRAFDADGAPLTPARRVGAGISPALAVGPAGEIVVAWLGIKPIPGVPQYPHYEILVRRFDAAGERLGEPVVVVANLNYPYQPLIAKDGEGNFLVVWNNFFQQPQIGNGIFGRRYGPDGVPLSGILRLEDPQDQPQLAMDRAGDFVLAWMEFNTGPSGRSDVFAQRFTPEGSPFRPAFQVERSDFGAIEPRLAGDANGNFVVVWQGRQGNLVGILAQRFRKR